MQTTKQDVSFFEVLRADMRAMKIKHTNALAMVAYLFLQPGYLAVALHRVSAASYPKGLMGRAVAKFCRRLNNILSACDIHPEAKIGKGFAIMHTPGIVIGKCVIGDNLRIFQNVTLGTLFGEAHNIRPCLGDNVSVYAGAVVIGNIKIGHSATIGANAVVNRDVPDNCTAVGVPARIIEHNKNITAV